MGRQKEREKQLRSGARRRVIRGNTLYPVVASENCRAAAFMSLNKNKERDWDRFCSRNSAQTNK